MDPGVLAISLPYCVQCCQILKMELSYRDLKIIVFQPKLSYIKSNNEAAHMCAAGGYLAT